MFIWYHLFQRSKRLRSPGNQFGHFIGVVIMAIILGDPGLVHERCEPGFSGRRPTCQHDVGRRCEEVAGNLQIVDTFVVKVAVFGIKLVRDTCLFLFYTYSLYHLMICSNV